MLAPCGRGALSLAARPRALVAQRPPKPGFAAFGARLREGAGLSVVFAVVCISSLYEQGVVVSPLLVSRGCAAWKRSARLSRSLSCTLPCWAPVQTCAAGVGASWASGVEERVTSAQHLGGRLVHNAQCSAAGTGPLQSACTQRVLLGRCVSMALPAPCCCTRSLCMNPIVSLLCSQQHCCKGHCFSRFTLIPNPVESS